MAREALPTELVERVVDSFAEVLPDGICLSLQGRALTAVRVAGGVSFGNRLGALPWPVMPPAVKWRLAVQGVYEAVARAIGSPQAEPPAAASNRDPFRTAWPVPNAKVHVDVSGSTISVNYVGPSGQPALRMPTIEWRGPRTVAREPSAADRDLARHYVGEVPDSARVADAERDREAATQERAMKDVLEAVERMNPGSDKALIRQAFRTASASVPDADPPPPGSKGESRLVDLYAAVHGRHPRVATTIELGKHLRDMASLIRGLAER